MSYQLYRNTTLGHTLQESLDELIQVSCLSLTINIYLKQELKKTGGLLSVNYMIDVLSQKYFSFFRSDKYLLNWH